MTSTVSILGRCRLARDTGYAELHVPRRRLRFDVHSVRISNTPAQRVFGIGLRHIIALVGGAIIHMEVKVGDTNFQKTYDTCRAMQPLFPKATSWRNFILIPEESLFAWENCHDTYKARISVKVLTWEQVAVALRRALLLGKENDSWTVWALSLCGAVEQKILGYLPLNQNQSPSVTDLIGIVGLTSLLRRAL